MRRTSIKFKFLFQITTTLVIVFLAINGLAYGLFSSAVQDSVVEKGQAMSQAVREKARSTLQFSNGQTSGLTGLSNDLAALLGGRDKIGHARIIDANGKIVSSNNASEIGKESIRPPVLEGDQAALVPHGDLYEVYTPIKSGLYVNVGIDKSRFTAKALRTTLLIFLVALAGLGVVWFLISHWVQENIERPLEGLSREATRVADGDLTADFTFEGNETDEVEHLHTAFAGMATGVRAIVAKISDVSTSVSTRTQQLKEENRFLTEAIVQQNGAIKKSVRSIEVIDKNTGEINGRVEELFLISQETSSSILQIGGSIEEVEQHVTKLSTAVGETSSSITEIGRSINEVASRAQDLAQNAESMTQAIHDITTTITSVEKNVQQSAELSKDVSLTAREGLESVEKSSEGMRRIKSAVVETNEVMQALAERSDQITEIVTVINQVTEKTNLLALNAAIIAAAAGEHGASFAVVADGIRDLARQVAAKTREIDDLVQGVQKEARKAKEKVDVGLTSVVEGEQLSNAAREKLRQIYDISLRSEEMSNHINNDMAEQNRNSRALAEASARVTNISQQIAMATQQEASASSQIQRSISQMEELANSVLRTTHEQGEGSRRISEATTRITEAIQAISEIAIRHKSESKAVLGTIQENQVSVNDSEARLSVLNEHIESVYNAVHDLQQEVGRFKVS